MGPMTAEPLRIAQLANFVAPHSGGMRVALDALGAEYVAAGHERLIVIPGPRDSWTHTSAGVVAQIASPRVSGTYRMIVRRAAVRRVLRRFRPTNIECSDKWTLARLAKAGWHRVGTVLFSHERLDDMLTGWLSVLPASSAAISKAVTPVVGRLNARLVPGFDEVVVASHYAADEFARWSSSVQVVPLGVDLDTFAPEPSHTVTATADLGHGFPTPGALDQPGTLSHPLRMALVSRLSHEKNPELAIDLALELARRGMDVHLDVYGTGPDEARLRKQARRGPITFHGFVADRGRLARSLARADISLSLCPTETFGLAVLEALSCGVPVVTANRGGAREIMAAGDQAASADSGSSGSGSSPWGAWAAPQPGKLADAVTALVPRLGPAMRAAARERAEQFSWRRCAGHMLQVHADAWHGKTRRSHA